MVSIGLASWVTAVRAERLEIEFINVSMISESLNIVQCSAASKRGKGASCQTP